MLQRKYASHLRPPCTGRSVCQKGTPQGARRRARFETDPDDVEVPKWQIRKTGLTTISHSYNIVKIQAALVQLAFGIVTIYRARGDQITMLGYAAFGLTVTSYAWMSLLNLLASLVRPSFASLFVVENGTLCRLLE